MRDWYETAKSIIRLAHETIPPDADLKARRRAIMEAKPHEFASTSWGTKTWARAQREYLVKYGYVPKTAGSASMPPLESPLERTKRRSAEHKALLDMSLGRRP